VLLAAAFLAAFTPRRTRVTRVAPREEAGVANFDDDMVVLGWGLCGSVAALRAVEKG
jgi:hypothetical protein